MGICYARRSILHVTTDIESHSMNADKQTTGIENRQSARPASITMRYLLPAVILLGTLAAALLLLRTFAPQLLGLPLDLQMVRTAKELPPFYEGIFKYRKSDVDGYLIADPHTVVRAPPLYPDLLSIGPNDLLGFRNRAVPNTADVVVLGDSQTYGNNTMIEANWPHVLAENLEVLAQTNQRYATVYSMATGGWAATQYAEMLANALSLEPRILIIAFYTGNDPLESARNVAANPRYESLIPDGVRKPASFPATSLGKGAEGNWAVKFKDGIETIFTPRVRGISNLPSEAADFGYAVMAHAAELIAAEAKRNAVLPVFTIIPTKELVYWPRVKSEGITPSEDYLDLVNAEQQRIKVLGAALSQYGQYVDLLPTLQSAALTSATLYPADANGHPIDAGHALIGERMTDAIRDLLPTIHQGLAIVPLETPAGQLITRSLVIVVEDDVWTVPPSVATNNGWDLTKPVQEVPYRDLATLKWHRALKRTEPEKFGPR